MKALSSKMTKPLQLGSRLVCVDNSGAKELEIIAVLGYKGSRRRLPRAGIGDIVVCSVKKGKEKMRKQVVHAVIVRQAGAWRRSDGTIFRCTDNAAVLINPKTFEPIGTEIRTPIAKEAVERFSVIGKIASVVL
jgi:large subunit ribosomal protein L14